tara:strand:+ start:556 stop:897 length:342 start_codon:yes stop_codon:yes gene_type:complete
MKNNTGRGYVVRFLEEKNNIMYFYVDRWPLCRKNDPWTKDFLRAKVFVTHKGAEDAIVDSKKTVTKIYGMGYMYISKTFYTVYKDNNRNNIAFPKRVATKLTKIDTNDFINKL